ncbi:zinc finger BED domain-containing protein RICESLEEPER 1-like [Quercus suber]|uniref:zinc finger BED domain-containing protein RICESLEEPER 1-like n=1 Tax=Quercus suber TaxID=58331 RepID=UPI000CE1BCBE|nr:zinc finger BED domain-containing protein RICESLEEPER 1-like [Quercus suber]
MCLTAHFIDDDWQYHKRILNFRQVPNHKGETIGKVVESLLLSWGIDKIFTLTVDNATYNSGTVTYLDRITKEWGASILGGEFAHEMLCTHCEPYCDGRYDKFKACVEKVKIASKGCVCLDVPIRWNSTYMMLENAEKFQRAFERLRVNDAQYIHYFFDDGNGKKILGPPDFEDWDNVKVFVKFLKLFYEVTLRFFGSLYVTSNVFFHELCVMKIELTNLCESEDPLLSMMAKDMHEKFDKYWGDIEKLNLMMFVAIVLDPRYKLRFLNFWFTKWNPRAVAKNMTKKVKKTFVRMYEYYCDCDGYSNGQGQDGSSSNNVETRPVQDPHALVKSICKMHLAADSLESKLEVERYLVDCVEEDSPNFCILNWWKVNSSKYRLLLKVARDVLAIPLSTVAFESACSTRGRVLDPF